MIQGLEQAMPEAIGYGASQTIPPAPAVQKAETGTNKADAARIRTSEVVAETVQRRAQFSASRAENLSEQAEKLEKRAESRSAGEGLGVQLDITV